MNFKELALKEESYILEQRRWLHAHPELGTKEYKTTEHIVNELKSFGIEVQVFDDITGCVGIIRGKQPGRTVMLRADIDALPIQEENDCGFCSQNSGVMHACGHDCHTAMLLAAGKMLAANKKQLHGTVKLLFQMAEEIGTESRHYVEKGCLDDVDAVFGQHVWALMDSGTVNFEDGERMACSDRFTITVTGKTAPADKPQQGSDAILAAAAVVMALQSLVSRVNNPENTLVVTTGKAAVKIMGEGCLSHLDKMTGAEDFSVFMEKTKGVYGFIGVRNLAKGLNCVHHHPKFAVDEDQLKYGAGIYAQFAYDYLNSDAK